MFGLEKEKKKRQPFEFDLEKEIRGNIEEKGKLLAHIDNQVTLLKKTLREGSPSEDFDCHGTLLQAYFVLKRVVNRINKKQ